MMMRTILETLETREDFSSPDMVEVTLEATPMEESVKPFGDLSDGTPDLSPKRPWLGAMNPTFFVPPKQFD